MDARLEDFVGLLRHNGLRVSPAEVADAARATVLIGLEQRDPFRAALRATLVKRGPDAPVFDRLFDLYFLGVKDLVEGLSGSLLDALAAEQLTELDLEEAARLLAQMHLSPLTDALVKGRAAELARLLRQAPTPVIARVERGSLLLDPRTVLEGEEDRLLAEVAEALGYN